jgi:hypothetical protein
MDEIQSRLLRIKNVRKIGQRIIDNAEQIEHLAVVYAHTPVSSHELPTFDVLSVGGDLASISLLEFARQSLYEDVFDGGRLEDDTD